MADKCRCLNSSTTRNLHPSARRISPCLLWAEVCEGSNHCRSYDAQIPISRMHMQVVMHLGIIRSFVGYDIGSQY